MADPIVYFEDSQGNVFSNDPRWLARKTLNDLGVEDNNTDFDMPGPYDNLSGAELKALAKEREISTKGFRKASQYREALEAWDDKQSNSDDEVDDESGSNESGDSKDEQE